MDSSEQTWSTISKIQSSLHDIEPYLSPNFCMLRAEYKASTN